jgi:hypothetical protein
VPCRSYLFGSSMRELVCSSSHELLILGMSLRTFNAMVSPCLLHDCIDTRCDSFGSARRKGLYLQRTTQHRNKKTNVHAPSLIRTHDLSNQAVKTDALGYAATGTGSTYITEKSLYFVRSPIYLRPNYTLRVFHRSSLIITVVDGNVSPSQ